jgi:hypothetical protein
MSKRKSYRTIITIWLGWILVIFGYQAYVTNRLDIVRPDYARSWTVNETLAGSQASKIYLNEPFLNSHVSWDSEYYLAIADGGYENPEIHRIGTYFTTGRTTGFWPFVIPTGVTGIREGVPLSYAFFPFYPLLIRALSAPLSILSMNPIATVTLAGVIVSLLGSLAGMLALYELARDELGEDGGLRAAFYLLIFPSGFFLAQVYTEGLFVGLAFWSLVMLRRGRLNWAAILAVLATFTRAIGVTLVVPLLISWIRKEEWRDLDLEWKQIYFNGIPWRIIGKFLIALSPILVFSLWKISYYGMAFGKVEEEFFGRGLLSLGSSFNSWSDSVKDIFGANPQAAAYYIVEWFGIILGFSACIIGFRRHPDLALFGFLAVFLSFTSGPAQGMHRYILAAPPVFLFLSRIGENKAFDRIWSILSILIMGVLAALFSFDMWTG